MESVKPELFNLHDENENKIGSKKLTNTSRQYYAVLCMNLLSFAYGATCGWPSAAILQLKSPETPLDSGPLSEGDDGWIASGIGIGGFFANFFFGWVRVD